VRSSICELLKASKTKHGEEGNAWFERGDKSEGATTLAGRGGRARLLVKYIPGTYQVWPHLVPERTDEAIRTAWRTISP